MWLPPEVIVDSLLAENTDLGREIRSRVPKDTVDKLEERLLLLINRDRAELAMALRRMAEKL